jgi:hypothetical protein
MPSTGTFLYHPELAELMDDAFEQAGVDPAKLNGRHLRSAARSAELMMGSWFNRGWKQWTLSFQTEPVIAGQQTFDLPAGGWDIFHATLQDEQGFETELVPIARKDFNALHDKTLTGRTDRYFTDRSGWIGPDPAATVYLYHLPDRPYNVNFWYIRRTEDIGKMSNTLDMPWNWKEAFTVGLAYRLAKKFPPPDPAAMAGAPTRVDKLMMEAEQLFALALGNDRELADTTFSMSLSRGRRR